MARTKRIKVGVPHSRKYSIAEQSVLRQAASILGVPVERLLSLREPSHANSNHEMPESEPLIFDDQSNLGQVFELEQLFSLDNAQFAPPNLETGISNTTL